jgi:hypothetical protein
MLQNYSAKPRLVGWKAIADHLTKRGRSEMPRPIKQTPLARLRRQRKAIRADLAAAIETTRR